MADKPRILIVDDEQNILSSLQRNLRQQYDLVTAQSGQEALDKMRDQPCFPVILTDMQMPGMNGLDFIDQARSMSDHTVFMMLTGNADLGTAVAAINRGKIFRFITKPCERDVLVNNLEAALRQYQLETAEDELLNKTVTGSLTAMTQLLNMVNPEALGRGSKILKYMRALISHFNLEDTWDIEMAALLCQVGFVALPPEIIQKKCQGMKLTAKENEIYESHPVLTKDILRHIPRLEKASKIINLQMQYQEQADPSNGIIFGAQMLQAVITFIDYLCQGMGSTVARKKLMTNTNINTAIAEAISEIDINPDDFKVETHVKTLELRELREGMYTDEDIFNNKGTLITPKGEMITEAMLKRLRNFALHTGLMKNKIRCIIPQTMFNISQTAA